MELFDRKDRENLNYAKNRHSTYRFYDGSAKEEFVRVRERMNDWFSYYPSDHQGQLKSDFKAQFDSAYFELFIHELFLKQGFNMKPHVSLDASTKTPDFLAVKEGLEIYIEAKVATDLTEAEVALRNRQDILLDSINEIPCKDFWLSINRLEFKTSRNPKTATIKAHIRDSFQDLRDELKGFEGSQNNPDFIRDYFYSDDCLDLEYALYPSTVEPEPLIVSQPPVAFWGGSDESIRKAVSNKARRYGLLDKPFIICINAISYKYTTARDAFNAIFGNHWVTEDGIEVIHHSDVNGIFNNTTPKFTTVSAVFITRTSPHNAHCTEHWLLENPSARNPIDFSHLDLSYYKLVDNKIVEIKKTGVPQILFGNNLPTEIAIENETL
ncbi:hypothetical protein [Dyadobacter frigoris]|uniref:Restriction endonuclease n=1 Tax=Dyadobacter frigoris TaxID=2576211 RepID=A0A4U6DDV7_9BACT|nr:hypothetical protein [Dyadobacter frigoris]TKT92644.1 hypothetical protein FDK13_07460 [Dyadobacter frigoris]